MKQRAILLQLRLADASNTRDDDRRSSVPVERELPRAKSTCPQKLMAPLDDESLMSLNNPFVELHQALSVPTHVQSLVSLVQ